MKQKIFDYLVAESFNADYLADRVRGLIKEGWQPIGGVSVNEYMFTSTGSPKSTSKYVQAMVLYDGVNNGPN